MKIVKLSVNQRYISLIDDAIKPAAELPFNNIFNDKYREVIPLMNPKLKELKNKLESGDTKSGKKWIVDVDSQTAKTLGDKREFRLGRIVNKDLGSVWADEYANQIRSKNKDDLSIVISRHPVDVLRMSDHVNLSSCHAPEDIYFNCAIEEAQAGGPVAYVVNSSDLEDLDVNNLDEIFLDNDRGKEGIQPLSRLRLNRYVNKHEKDSLALPVPSTYGREVAGFFDSVVSWSREKQPEFFNDAKNVEMDDWTRVGGSYKDVQDYRLFDEFFDRDDFSGETDYDGSDEVADLAEQMQIEIDTATDRYDLKYFQVTAEVEESDNIPYLSMHTQLLFEFTGYEGEDGSNYELTGNEDIDIENEIMDIVEVGSHDISEVYYYMDNGNLRVVLSLNYESYGNENPADDYLDTLRECDYYEVNSYKEDYARIQDILIDNGIIGGVSSGSKKEMLSDFSLTNFNISFDKYDKSMQVKVNVPVDIARLPNMSLMQKNTTRKFISDYISNYMNDFYTKDINTFLIQEFKPEIDMGNAPKVDVFFDSRINSTYITMQFNLYLPDTEADSINDVINYLKYLDGNFPNLVKDLQEKAYFAIKQNWYNYEGTGPAFEEPTTMAKNWYNLSKESTK
jgi:hypothetical protein